MPPELPSLDYAFLADFARVDPNGTLTVVGASFTMLQVEALPVGHLFSIAGRVRIADGSGPVALTAEVAGPEGSPRIGVQTELRQGDHAVVYQGRVGVVFCLTTIYPIGREGLYTVTLSLEGRPVRHLAFEASRLPTDG